MQVSSCCGPMNHFLTASPSRSYTYLQPFHQFIAVSHFMKYAGSCRNFPDLQCSRSLEKLRLALFFLDNQHFTRDAKKQLPKHGILSGSKKLCEEIRHLLFFIAGLGSEVVLLCSSCNESFLHPWDLLVHVQKTHSLNIFDEATDGLMPSEMITQKEASAMMTIG